MKKTMIVILLVMSLSLFTSCKKATDIDTQNSQKPTEVSTTEESSNDISDIEGKQYDEYRSELDKAIINAIYNQNAGNYLQGECQGVGYTIIETFEDQAVLSVYALTEYAEYRFEDAEFVRISGTNPKVLIKFKITEEHSYELVDYIRLDILSGLTDDELEKLMQPLKETGKSYLYTDSDLRAVREQADACAQTYLKSIGREASVHERNNHEFTSLSVLIENQDVLRSMVKNNDSYPDWTGSLERLENGKRYIYQTTFDKYTERITYTKTLFDTNEVITKMVFDTTNSERIS